MNSFSLIWLLVPALSPASSFLDISSANYAAFRPLFADCKITYDRNQKQVKGLRDHVDGEITLKDGTRIILTDVEKTAWRSSGGTEEAACKNAERVYWDGTNGGAMKRLVNLTAEIETNQIVYVGHDHRPPTCGRHFLRLYGAFANAREIRVDYFNAEIQTAPAACPGTAAEKPAAASN